MNAKVCFILIVLCVVSFDLFSQQWTTSGSNIYNSNAGNVGIGITAPVSKLQVLEGDLRISATTTNRSLIFDAVSSVNIANLIKMRRDNVERWIFGSNGNAGTDDFFFSRFSNTGAFLGSPILIKRATGNVIFDNSVGIGTPLTNNPNSYRLAVNGVIGAKEVKVENTTITWPDYVFSHTYNLRSLNDLASFINENGHLPDVPSAKDVSRDGHNLGEMDAILLRKIEELTLYLLELKKENESLRKELLEGRN